MSRLATQYADLHQALDALGSSDQRAAAERLVAAALAANALTADDASVPGAVERLDEHAWQVQDRVERGEATQQQYEDAFRRARAASAVQTLNDPDSALDDAVYEAVHGLPATEDALPIIIG